MKLKDVVREFKLSDEQVENELNALIQEDDKAIDAMVENSVKRFEVDTIIPGTIVNISNSEVVVDVGYKSEGVLPLEEFEGRHIELGLQIDVLLEAIEDETGAFVISKRKADRIRGWETVITRYKEGDVVTGMVTRKIKGGLLVDIGVPVFLPASQVSIRRTGDIAEYIGKQIQCKIIKIDESRMNIVVSRRRLIEEERAELKTKLLKTLKVGDMVKGVVKNIADFGCFVDLGGLDGLLHITDMSWGRISHPSEMVKINDAIEVKVLKIDLEKERIALGLKQKSASPWENVAGKYPVGTKVKGEVVNITNYGAFVKLEEGIEGLVHISEMSWTKRVNHPSEMVNIGEDVEVVVLDVNPEKMEISLGMKQTESNPWEGIEERFPVGSIVEGKVRNLTNYGAFIELEAGIDGLLHVSDISWTKKIAQPGEVLTKDESLRCVVLGIDKEKKRIALGIKQLTEDPWNKDILNKYIEGKTVKGKVTKITNFGVFVELEDDLEALLHVSELTDQKGVDPESLVSVGQAVEAKIIKVDSIERKIGLSIKALKEE